MIVSFYKRVVGYFLDFNSGRVKVLVIKCQGDWVYCFGYNLNNKIFFLVIILGMNEVILICLKKCIFVLVFIFFL